MILAAEGIPSTVKRILRAGSGRIVSNEATWRDQYGLSTTHPLAHVYLETGTVPPWPTKPFHQTFDACYMWSPVQSVVVGERAGPVFDIEVAEDHTFVVPGAIVHNCVIEDDTISPALDDLTGEMYVPRKDEMEKAIGWHRIAEPLLVNPGEDTRIVVGTRWAEEDLLGTILREEDYDVFKVACVTNIPTDGDWRQGEPLYFRYPLERLEQIHATLGDYFFNSLYLNDPLPNAARLFKSEYFRWFEEPDVPSDAYRVLCVDPAVSETEAADYTGFTVCAHSPGALYVLHASHGKLSPSSVIERALSLCAQYQVSHLRMETIALAQTFIEAFRHAIRERQLGIYFEPVKSQRGSKVERILSLEPFFNNGQVLLRRTQNELMTELLRFNPETFTRQRQKVDIIDSLSMHVPLFRQQQRQREQPKPWDGVLTYEWLEQQCKGLRKYHGNTQRYRTRPRG